MSKMTMAAVALSFFISIAGVRGQQPTPAVDALDGVDVVVLLQEGKEAFGKSAIQSTHEGFTYLFVSAENKAAFDKTPEKYAIQLGGLCARMGGTVRGNPSDYVVHDGKIYIFGSDQCRTKFTDAPAKYIPKPTAPMPTDAASVTRGRELLEKVAAAHGGAKLDAMTSFVETSTSIQDRPTGPVSIPTRYIWRFPGEARSERTLPMPSGPLTVATVLTKDGAWGVGGNGRISMPIPAAVPAIEAMLWRSPVALLRVRGEAGVKVAALTPASAGTMKVERVRIVRHGLDVTLNIHTDSGRLHSWSYVDRNAEGEVGEITVTFGDFRTIDGVLVPFVESAVFQGAPDAVLSRTVDTVSVNASVDPSLFAAPPSGGAR
jgi:YHS domain-containing protein